MANQYIWIMISVGIFFAGFTGGYVVSEQTYSPKNLMVKDPQTTTQWMSIMFGTMMNDQDLRNEMMTMMMQNPDMMQDMVQNKELMGMMGQNMMGSGMMSGPMMSGMQFNTDAPMTMPMIDGYYNGEKVFFVHTEVSDKDMADMMSMMINFPTLHVSDLTNIPQNELSKVYVFTNGITGSGPYGGGPFMFQIDVFDSIPGQMGYSQFRTPHLVTWNDDATPRIMTSEDEILEAESNGELTIQKTGNVVNAPMMVWKSDGMTQRATMVQRMFESMSGVDGEITNVDIDNYVVMMKLHPSNGMSMMQSQQMMIPNIEEEITGLYNKDLNPRQIEYPNHLGFNDLHIEAINHLIPSGDDSVLDMIVHHHCKVYDDMTAACLLFPTGMDDQDKPYGMEYVIGVDAYAELPDEEKKYWHYHETELPKVKASLPDLTAEEAEPLMPMLNETYGKVVYFWQIGDEYPIGEPFVVMIEQLYK